MRQLFKSVEVRRLKPDGTNYTITAGTGDTLTSDAIDTDGYEAVGIEVILGPVVDGGACYVKVQQSSDDGSSDNYSDLADSKQTIGDSDDNKTRLIDIYRPAKRYLKLITVRATQNLTIHAVIVHLFGGGSRPVTQGSTVAGYEAFNTPAEGTA